MLVNEITVSSATIPTQISATMLGQRSPRPSVALHVK